jgi:hypothetical protein
MSFSWAVCVLKQTHFTLCLTPFRAFSLYSKKQIMLVEGLDTQTTGASSPGMAQAVTVNAGDGNAKRVENKGESHDPALAVAVCLTVKRYFEVRIPLSPPV